MNNIFILFISLSISGSLIAIILFALNPIFRARLSKTWQYYIWFVVILRLLIPLAPTFSFVDTIINNINTINYKSNTKNNKEDIKSIIIEEESLEVSHITQKSEIQKTSIYLNIKNNLWIFWLSIAVILIVHKLTSYYSFLRFIKSGSFKVSDLPILEVYKQTCDELKIKKVPQLYSNKLAVSPMLTGIFKVFIVLPQIQLPKQKLYYIFKHELTHYKRMDIFYKWLVQFTNCLHWFNPVVYLISKEVNRYCELSCDEMVIKNLDKMEKQEYGDTLLSAIKGNGNYSDTIVSTTLNENVNLLKERLESIMNFNKKSKLVISITVVLTLVICLGATFTGAYTINTDISIDKLTQNTKPTKTFIEETQQNQSISNDKNVIIVEENEKVTLSSSKEKYTFEKYVFDMKVSDNFIVIYDEYNWGEAGDFTVGLIDENGDELEWRTHLKNSGDSVEVDIPKDGKYRFYFVNNMYNNASNIEYRFTCSFMNITNVSNYPTKINNSQKLNSSDADKEGIRIMEDSGTWGQSMERVLPQMTSLGIEKAISIYMDKHCYTPETTANAISVIETAFPYMTPESIQRVKDSIPKYSQYSNNNSALGYGKNFVSEDDSINKQSINNTAKYENNSILENNDIKKNLNSADIEGIIIMEKSGTWGDSMEKLLPKMTSTGIEIVLSIYIDRHSYNPKTKAILETSFSYMTPEAIQRVKDLIPKYPK